jgi:hypothetical protein
MPYPGAELINLSHICLKSNKPQVMNVDVAAQSAAILKQAFVYCEPKQVNSAAGIEFL